MKNDLNNYMVLIKEGFNNYLISLLKSPQWNTKELPRLVHENDKLIIFKIPNGKLRRLTEFSITQKIQTEMIDTQEKLNKLTANTGLNWDWRLNYFFITKSGLMYIDLETLCDQTEPSILKPPVYKNLTQKERILLKMSNDKKLY